MPFSSLTDPVQLARAHAALEAAWAEIKASHLDALGAEAEDRERLKYIVANLAPVALDEVDLVQRAVARFVGKLLRRA